MKASLISREIIADSIELVGRGHMFDAVIALVGCDKTMPGAAMGVARLDVPAIVLYGGSIMPGRYRGQDITIGDVYEAVGAHAAGRISDQDLYDIEANACPVLGPAAVSSQPTPWLPFWSSSASRPWARPPSPPWIRAG
jgi:dihydroxy-acid dehydratase